MSKATNPCGYPHNSFFITKAKVKRHIHAYGLELSNNAFDTLNDKVQVLLTESIERAKQNSRKRLLARDV
jgi:hypothetical protein